MPDGLGLLVDETPEIEASHMQALSSLMSVPPAFCAGETPPDFESPIPAWDQDSTSSCAGHAGAANFTHRQYVETGEIIKYSPWFSYITSQNRGGFTGRDGGTSIQSVIDAATLDGCCLEELCQRPQRYSTSLSRDAIRDAAAHKHIGRAVDLREFDVLMAWLYDKRSAVIGTLWTTGLDSVDGPMETLRHGKEETRRGYHARALIGHRKGLPVVLNSHGTGWGENGRACIEQDLWEWWKKDPYFVALGFLDINERVPKRRSYLESRAGDRC